MADVTARSFALTKLPPVCGGGVAVTCWLSLGWVCRGVLHIAVISKGNFFKRRRTRQGRFRHKRTKVRDNRGFSVCLSAFLLFQWRKGGA